MMNVPNPKMVILLGLALGSYSCGGSGDKGTAESSAGLVVVTYGGGAYQQSHIDAFTKPFSESKNIRVDSVVWGAEYGKLQEMVRSGTVPWDVVEVTASQFSRGRADNLFEPISKPILETTFVPLEGSPGPADVGVPMVYWSTVLAYRPDAFGGNVPSTWQDFWNIDAFPGDRALYDNPRGTLEFALLAAGKTKEELYPLDVDKAFAQLDLIRDHVRIWWTDGTQPVNAMLSGRVVMSSAWSGRLFASAQARAEIAYTWNGAAHELDYWVIPRGSTRVELASQFITFASSPGPMARQAEATAYGPANSLALAQVAATILPYLPTAPDNWAVSFVIDSEWWAANEQSVGERWLIWKSQ